MPSLIIDGVEIAHCIERGKPMSKIDKADIFDEYFDYDGGKMKNEIKKLYENANLDRLWVERYSIGNGFENEIWHNSYNEMIKSMMKTNNWTLTEAKNVAKKECQRELLPFTAEKQLLLIKWLAKKDDFALECWPDNEDDWCEITFKDIAVEAKSFEQCLAAVFNAIWNDLSTLDKKEIQTILR